MIKKFSCFFFIFFQVHISSSPDPVAGMLACSDNMFVHNNSKHGRKSRKMESAYGEPFSYSLSNLGVFNYNVELLHFLALCVV